MKIRFISDIHAALNMTTSPMEFVQYMRDKKPADYTLIAGDMDADIGEANNFLRNYFKDEKVIFIGGNHIVYNRRGETLETLISDYKKEFNGQWKFIENDYVWLNEDIAVIGCIGWTDFLFGYQSKSDYVKKINKEKEFRKKHPTAASLGLTSTNDPICYIDNLPEDPASDYDERGMGDKKSYRKRRMMDALRGMNDYQMGYMLFRDKKRLMTPYYIYKQHRLAMREIKRCYNEIVTKNPNATIILMTHHPFTKKCESAKYKGDPLNAAFISDHDRWLKNFPNIKYIHCGHVHSRFFKKLQDKQIICNPMGYLGWYEDIAEPKFDINKTIEIGEK